jgi:cysteinyl-tRNA synthetase
MNITDVGHLTSDEDEGEDKLQKGARREGKTAWEVAAMYTDDFLKGMKHLNLVRPEHITKATEFINEQLDLIRVLKEKGYTYQISDGIYFDTAKFPTYADFAGLDLAAQQAGARVEYNPEKRNPSDFALWKFSPTDEQRDMEWDTPSDLLENGGERKGFPGWHLECSAMAMSLLGNTLDIHTGGIDHIPVHHTNEIAQSESASGVRFSNYWLHNNHMKVDGSKISKSLGNGYTLQDLEAKGFSPLDFRLLVLQSHYQSEANFSFESLQAAKNRRLHWRAVAGLRWQISVGIIGKLDEQAQQAEIDLIKGLNDNLNTPETLRIIDGIFSAIEASPFDTISKERLLSLLVAIDNLLGLQLLDSTPDIHEDMKRLIAERETARQNKNWAESDRLRDILASNSIRVSDTSSSTTMWSYTN